ITVRTEKDNDTKRMSLELFNRGHDIAEIAERRGLKQGTIETHLAFYVQHGTLEIHKLISEEKAETIRAALEDYTSLSAVKERLGDDYSYGEIRMVMAHREFEKQSEAVEMVGGNR